MDRITIVVSVLFVLLNPASCRELSLTDPVICYILDGVLVLYCIIVTVLFFREKLLRRASPATMPEPQGCIYQELGMSRDADAYEVLQPFKKKREKRRKKSEAAQSDREAGAEPVPGTSSSEHPP